MIDTSASRASGGRLWGRFWGCSRSCVAGRRGIPRFRRSLPRDTRLPLRVHRGPALARDARGEPIVLRRVGRRRVNARRDRRLVRTHPRTLRAARLCHARPRRARIAGLADRLDRRRRQSRTAARSCAPRATSPHSPTPSSSSPGAGSPFATRRSQSSRQPCAPGLRSSRSRSCTRRQARSRHHAAIVAAAARVGARTCVDLTQSLGWLPVGAATFDYSVCHAYKWLCAPRGTAFLTVRAGLDETLTPLAAGWCSADDVWGSCYAGPHPALRQRRPLRPLTALVRSVPGTEGALRAVRLARCRGGARPRGRARERRAFGAWFFFGCWGCWSSGNSAIVTWPDADGSELAAMQAAGIVVSGRAGNARVAFHLWNTLATSRSSRRRSGGSWGPGRGLGPGSPAQPAPPAPPAHPKTRRGLVY